MKLTVKVLFFHVVLPLIDKLATGYTIYHYYDREDCCWALATAACLLLPGTLELLSSTFQMICKLFKGQRSQVCCDCFYWAILFGPFLFPFSIILWHFYHICEGENNFLRYEQRARSKVLNSLNALSRSTFQLTLQITILIITWKSSIIYLSEVVHIVVVSLVHIAVSATTHHYFEVSGKRSLPSFRDMFGRFLMYLLHISSRSIVISLLAAYLRHFIFTLIIAMVILNFILAKLILRTRFSKNVFTSCASVVLPICFISKDQVPQQDNAKKKFSQFYTWNTFIFFIIFGVIGLVVTNV